MLTVLIDAGYINHREFSGYTCRRAAAEVSHFCKARDKYAVVADWLEAVKRNLNLPS